MASTGHAPKGDQHEGKIRRRRFFGRARPGAVVTAVVLVAVVLLLQRQLWESRRDGHRSDAYRSRAANLAPVGGTTSGGTTQGPRSDAGTAPASARVLVAPSAGRGTGHFRGRVLDPQGRPIAAAEITMGLQSATSDADGLFALRWTRGTLRASHPDFWAYGWERSSLELLREVEASSRDLGVTPRLVPPGGTGDRTLPLLLLPGARVSGSVTMDGQPAEGARVLVSTGQRRWEVVTDADGGFTSPLLPAAALSLLVLHSGYAPSLEVLPWMVTGWHHRVQVELERGVPLRVRVENDNARPVGDAEVWVRSVPIVDGDQGGDTVEWEFVGWTDDLGRIDAARSHHRPAQLEVRAPGYKVATRPLLAAESYVRLERAPFLRGAAVDAESGLPVALRAVNLEVRQENGFVSCPDLGQQYQALGEGRFIVGLPPFSGVYRLSLRGAKTLAGHSSAVSFDGNEVPPPVLVPLERHTVIAGYVSAREGAVGGATVDLLSVPDADARAGELHGVRVPPEYQKVGSVTADAKGRFEFRDQGPGLYRVHVSRPGRREYYSPIFVPPLDEDLPVALGRGAALTGTLLDIDGAAESKAPLVLTDGDAVRRVAWTDGEGRYEFSDLPGGEYLLGLGLRAGQRRVRAVETRRLSIRERQDLTFNMRRRLGLR